MAARLGLAAVSGQAAAPAEGWVALGGLGMPKGLSGGRSCQKWAEIQPGQAAGLAKLSVRGNARGAEGLGGRGHRQCKGNLWVYCAGALLPWA